eukprot:m.167181 g.167181  ORF g.167181 m.167181 type:complete len:52 (-) comp14453_c0_seq1:1725-1880(-)
MQISTIVGAAHFFVCTANVFTINTVAIGQMLFLLSVHSILQRRLTVSREVT